MANYYGVGRTNRFKVKDPQAFKDAMANVSGVNVIQEAGDPEVFLVLDDNCDGGGWCITDEEDELLHIEELISPHLQENSIAIIMESGHEKHRYVSGYAIAINHKGEYEAVTLSSIYDLAKERFGDNVEITPAEY